MNPPSPLRSRPPAPRRPSPSLPLCLFASSSLTACLLPVCLVPRLKFQNFLLLATFRAASTVHVCVCACVRGHVHVRQSLCNFLIMLSASQNPPPDTHTHTHPHNTTTSSSPLHTHTVFLVPHCLLLLMCVSPSPSLPVSPRPSTQLPPRPPLFVLRVLTCAPGQRNARQIMRMDARGLRRNKHN